MKPERSEMEATISGLMRAASEFAFERSEDDTAQAFVLSNLLLIEMIRHRFAPAWQRGELFGAAPGSSEFN